MLLGRKETFSLFHLFIILGLSVLAKNETDFWKTVTRSENLYSEMGQLVTNILSKTKSGHCFAFITDSIFYKTILNTELFDSMKGLPVFIITIDDSEDMLLPHDKTVCSLLEIRKAGCQFYLILITNGIQMERLLRFGDKYRVLDTRARFLFLHDYRLFTTKMHYIWRRFINVIFLREYIDRRPGNNVTLNNPWIELTTVPFPSPVREIFVPKQVDFWRDGHYSHRRSKNLFTDKTVDLKAQLMRAVVLQHTPAVARLYKSDGEIFYSGVEIELIKALGKAMNFTIELFETPDANYEKWGRIELNGTATGLIGDMMEGKTDFALGDLYNIPYFLTKMDLSIPYGTECLTFLTPELLSDNSWQTLILPFSPGMWLGVGISLLLVGIIFYILSNSYAFIHGMNDNKISSTKPKKFKKIKFWKPPKSSIIPNDGKNTQNKKQKRVRDLFDDFSVCILFTFSMLLVVSLPKLPRRWPIRLLTGWYYVYCILVVVSYRASLTAILANPAPRLTIDTLEQLANSPISCGAWGEQIKEFFITSLDEADQKIGEKLEQINDLDGAIHRVAKGEYAYYENEHFLRQIRSKRNQDEDQQTLHIMKQCVIHMPISLGLQKNSPMKPRTDKYLRQLIETGLVKKWLIDAIEDFAFSVEAVPQEALVDIKKLYGAFVALGIGYLLACFTLLAEIIHFKYFIENHPLYDKYALGKFYANRE